MLTHSEMLDELESLRAQVKAKDAEIARLRDELQNVRGVNERLRKALEYARPLQLRGPGVAD